MYEPFFKPFLVKVSGIIAGGLIKDWISKKIDLKSEKLDTRNVVPKKPEEEIIEKVMRTGTSIRFESIINELFFNPCFKTIPINKVATSLGFISELSFKQYYSCTDPSFDLLDRFSLKYNINAEWLKYGIGAPFLKDRKTLQLTIDQIKEKEPYIIYFVQSKKSGKSGIILKLNEMEYHVFDNVFILNSDVGSSGRDSIVEFYRLIIECRKNFKLMKIWSYYVEETLFDNLFSGTVYPGIIDKSSNNKDVKYTYWADDLLDYKREIKHLIPSYEIHRGVEFMKVQDILRDELEAA